MRAVLMSATAALALGAASAAAAAPSVRFKDAVVRVEVIPEARGDIKVEVLTTHASLPLVVRTQGDETIIDGDLGWGRIQGCNTVMGATQVRVRGIGVVKWQDIPRVVVRVPLKVDAGGDGAVFGNVGRSDSLDLAHAGCGDWTVANVKNRLELNQAGSGDVHAGSAGSAEINIAGSGDVAMREVAGDLEVSIAGSGGVTAASIAGRLEVAIAGSGDVTIEGGMAREIEVSILGSGDVDFRGVAGSAEVSVAGSGDVHIAKATGPVSKSIAGSGSVTVGP